MMVSPLDWITDKANSPATRIISGLVSLGLVASIFINIIPKEYVAYAFGFLAWHIINQLYFAFSEFKIPTCHRCNKRMIPVTTVTYPRHTCRLRSN